MGRSGVHGVRGGGAKHKRRPKREERGAREREGEPIHLVCFQQRRSDANAIQNVKGKCQDRIKCAFPKKAFVKKRLKGRESVSYSSSFCLSLLRLSSTNEVSLVRTGSTVVHTYLRRKRCSTSHSRVSRGVDT